MVKLFEQYIEETEIPIIAEFVYKHLSPLNLDKVYLYDRLEFSTLLKKCVAKKEAALEAKALKGDVNVSMAIFSLKQMGWRDKFDVAGNEEKKVTIVNDLGKKK